MNKRVSAVILSYFSSNDYEFYVHSSNLVVAGKNVARGIGGKRKLLTRT
jgi:hypothetical protein